MHPPLRRASTECRPPGHKPGLRGRECDLRVQLPGLFEPAQRHGAIGIAREAIILADETHRLLELVVECTRRFGAPRRSAGHPDINRAYVAESATFAYNCRAFSNRPS